MSNITEISKRALQFWQDAGAKKWFVKSDKFDADIRLEFGADIEYLADSDLVKHFENSQDGNEILGIIVCVDQFRRNLYRDDPKAFSQDHKGLALANLIQKNNLIDDIDEGLRMFAHMPYMHSEDIGDQEKSLELFNNSEFAIIHYDLIKAYSRFPHRNKILGRTSSNAELEFLKTDGFKG